MLEMRTLNAHHNAHSASPISGEGSAKFTSVHFLELTILTSLYKQQQKEK